MSFQVPGQDDSGTRQRSCSPSARHILDPKVMDEKVYTSLIIGVSGVGRREVLDSTPIAVTAEYIFLPSHRETCSCACHVESRGALQGLLGFLFLGYHGLPLLTKPCTNQACQRQSSSGFTVTYYFPRWFFIQRMVSLDIRATAMAGLQVKLRFPHIVSPLASIFYIAGFGTPDQLKFLFDNELASPFDTHVNTGASPLHVSQWSLQCNCKLIS